METKGLQVQHGYVLAESIQSASGYGMVPMQFWSRLKHQLGLRHMLDAFKAEYLDERSKYGEAGWDPYTEGLLAEQRLFVRWTRAAGLALPRDQYGGELWPWSRGWNDALIDSYLQPDHLKVVAAAAP